MDNPSKSVTSQLLDMQTRWVVAGIPETAETRLTASLQGIAWQNIGWFDSL